MREEQLENIYLNLFLILNMIRGCNMSCLKVGAKVGRPTLTARLTILKKI